jgi:hypothetical protein
MARELWVKKAFGKNKGALHRALGVPEGEDIPLAKLTKAAKAKGKLGRQARLALTARKFKRGKAAMPRKRGLGDALSKVGV